MAFFAVAVCSDAGGVTLMSLSTAAVALGDIVCGSNIVVLLLLDTDGTVELVISCLAASVVVTFTTFTGGGVGPAVDVL